MSKKSFLKGSSATLLVSSVGGSFVPSNVKADDSFVLDKKCFLKKNLSRKNLLNRDSIQESEDNSSSSNDYLVAFKSTVAYWWLKFCESSVFKYFFGKSSESKKVEEKVPKTVVLSEEKVKKIKELASKLEEKFGDKIKLEPYKDGKIEGTIVIGGWSYDLSIELDANSEQYIKVYKIGKSFYSEEAQVKEFADWYDILGKTLERIDQLVNAGLFVKTVSKKTGVILLEPTFGCRINFSKHEIYAIECDPATGYVYFITTNHDDKVLHYLHSGYVELSAFDNNGAKLFDSIVSKILEDYKNNDKNKSSFETVIYDDIKDYSK